MNRTYASLACILGGAAIVIAGVAMAFSDAVAGSVTALIGVFVGIAPLLGPRAPCITFDGGTVRITGILIDASVDIRDVDSVSTVPCICPVVMAVGYSGSRYYGGRFVDKDLGRINAAVDSRIPLCIVLECGTEKFVFNNRDEDDTRFLYMRLQTAVEEVGERS